MAKIEIENSGDSPQYLESQIIALNKRRYQGEIGVKTFVYGGLELWAQRLKAPQQATEIMHGILQSEEYNIRFQQGLNPNPVNWNLMGNNARRFGVLNRTVEGFNPHVPYLTKKMSNERSATWGAFDDILNEANASDNLRASMYLIQTSSPAYEYLYKIIQAKLNKKNHLFVEPENQPSHFHNYLVGSDNKYDQSIAWNLGYLEGTHRVVNGLLEKEGYEDPVLVSQILGGLVFMDSQEVQNHLVKPLRESVIGSLASGDVESAFQTITQVMAQCPDAFLAYLRRIWQEEIANHTTEQQLSEQEKINSKYEKMNERNSITIDELGDLIAQNPQFIADYETIDLDGDPVVKRLLFEPQRIRERIVVADYHNGQQIQKMPIPSYTVTCNTYDVDENGKPISICVTRGIHSSKFRKLVPDRKDSD